MAQPMKHPTLTIFTPAYNRAHLLPVLYKSLTEQTCKDFQWLIVDDGSVDDTQEVVRGFQEKGLVPIRYHRQENGGKYMAHNQGVRMCDTELFACVDSDDHLYPDAVESILAAWERFREDPKVCGVLSIMDMGGHSRFIDPPEKSDMMSLYNRGQCVGETTPTFRSEVLKAHLFPEIPGERFLSECVIFYPIDKEYVFGINDHYVSIGAYQCDGLTANMRAIEWNNPSATLVMLGTIAAYQRDYKTAVKGYGSFLAWKTVRKAVLPATWTLPKVSFKVRLGGWLLYLPYCYKHWKRKKEFTAH